MARTDVITLDLNFKGMPQSIAAYLVSHSAGAVLVECGPGSTIEALTAGLAANGYSPRDVTHVLLTHIHLDHAGAAGWLARQGAKICVHPAGAPHLVDPEKLLRSAKRIYTDEMDSLWGEFLPVPETSLIIPGDGEELHISGLCLTAVDAPGHAEHHYAYLLDDLCFTGDIGGIRIPGFPYVRVPMPPPELHLEKWQASIRRLQQLHFKRIAPTHFGVFDDADWHLEAMEREIGEILRWLEDLMRSQPDVGEVRRRFVQWSTEGGIRHGLSPEAVRSYDLANPLGMSGDGLYRYWNKVRNPTAT